jgi:Trk-type K+ transport system membrane component
MSVSFFLTLEFGRAYFNASAPYYLSPAFLVLTLFFAVLGGLQFYIIYKIYAQKEPMHVRLPFLASRLINITLLLMVCLVGFLFILVARLYFAAK